MWGLWELNQHNMIWQEGKHIFGFGNGISICNRHKDYTETYSFYAAAAHHHINHFYLSHLDFLEQFKNHFLEKAAPLLKSSEKNPFILPTCYLDLKEAQSPLQLTPELKTLFAPASIADLTPRETLCLLWLAKGKTASEIAYETNLSKRTVENYLANIRIKWDCNKSSQLIKKAYQLGLVVG